MSHRDYPGPINPAALDALRLLDDDNTHTVSKQLIELYISSSASYLKKLALAKTPETFQEIAHTWKSSSMSVGAEELASLCQSLEEHARDATHVSLIIKKIEIEYSNVIKTLNSIYK